MMENRSFDHLAGWLVIGTESRIYHVGNTNGQACTNLRVKQFDDPA
jgi:hypothetical protein